MQRILVICGAGASSTFLVHWMRKVAFSRGLEISIAAGSQADLTLRLSEVDIVLVGSHLHETFPQLREQADAAGVRALLLPPVEYSAAGAGTALDLVGNRAAASAVGSVSEPHGLHDPGSLHG